MDWVLAGLGLIILLLAGDALVKGAVNLALRLGIPALIVSLTVVAFGTSAPELLISISAVLDHAPGIALGNVVGSNTANILLVLGVPAMIKALHTAECDTRHSYLMMIAASVLFIAACFTGPITWIHGVVLLAGLAAMLMDQARRARAHRREEACDMAEDDELEGLDPELPGWRIGMLLVLGLVGLPLGADLLVESGVNIARRFGVTETVIGLTLIAAGTSLPELATTVMAALRNKADVALGNVIGSNLFNLLGIIGVASLFGHIPVDPAFLQLDLWVMLAASLALAPFVFLKWNLNRGFGALLCAAYLAYLTVLLM
ncbi:MAG: calcium/sodium antiporter [Rhodobacteraceae bacterium]|nr:calcium/sodium antiporter [Paracoccaceae bacterium]